MRSETRCLFLSVSCAAVLLTCLAGCPTRPREPQASSAAKVGVIAPAPASLRAPRHEGRPFDVSSRESLLTLLAFRGGTLGKLGHNHVIASHDVSGTFYVPDDASHATFELHIPVGQLQIDEPDLRAKEGPDFATEVSDAAKEGTRHNMLSEALLNGAQFPDIILVSQHIDAAGPQIHADVQITVRGQTHTISVPVTYSLLNGDLTTSGELPLRQTDLGLTPFSAMLGALTVQDEMRVRFQIVAHESPTKSAAGS